MTSKYFVAEWDEYNQGYDVDGNLVVCICGEYRPSAYWVDHLCPYDDPNEEAEKKYEER